MWGTASSARYHPDALALYLIGADCGRVWPRTWPRDPGRADLAAATARDYATDPQAGCQLLAELDEELRRRTELLAAAGATRLAGLPPDPTGRNRCPGSSA